MKRLFRGRLLFVVSVLAVLFLFAPPRRHPLPAELRTRIVSDKTPDEIFIHIRSDRQHETATRIRQKLMRDSYLVPPIIMVSIGPDENQLRYFHYDRALASASPPLRCASSIELN